MHHPPYQRLNPQHLLEKVIGFSWLPSIQRTAQQVNLIRFVPISILPASDSSPLNYWRVFCLSHKSKLCESIGSKVADMPGFVPRWHGPAADNAEKHNALVAYRISSKNTFDGNSCSTVFLF
jgi:hypothetical protein